MGGVSRLYKNKYTPKERIKRAANWIDKHGVITLQEYATLNNLSRTSASGELKKLSQGDEAQYKNIRFIEFFLQKNRKVLSLHTDNTNI
ncbi:hypothetical protein [Prevotella sp.]|uniref:hypothetical protein n=1 Tax=Prevotella sp. TaxID=59823 RepID=UPI003AF7B08C